MRAFELLGYRQLVDASVCTASGVASKECRTFGAFGESGRQLVHVQITESVTRECLIATFAFYIIIDGAI